MRETEKERVREGRGRCVGLSVFGYVLVVSVSSPLSLGGCDATMSVKHIFLQ